MAVFIPQGEYVTTAEAATILGISNQRVSQLARDGKIPSVGAEGTRLIPREAVDERLERLGRSGWVREQARKLESDR
jgi:excisionase family DNA binding protein